MLMFIRLSDRHTVHLMQKVYLHLISYTEIDKVVISRNLSNETFDFHGENFEIDSLFLYISFFFPFPHRDNRRFHFEDIPWNYKFYSLAASVLKMHKLNIAEDDRIIKNKRKENLL